MASNYMGKITRACCYNTFEFFCTKAAATELRQPTNVIVLSTNKLMESDHGMSLSANLLAMESGIFYTLAPSSPPVKHIPKNGPSLFTNHCRKTCVDSQDSCAVFLYHLLPSVSAQEG